MGTQVLAIGLDSADPRILEHYLSLGALPNLARLRQQGGWAPIKFTGPFNAELPWTAFILGCDPKELGYWDFFGYDPARYEMLTRGAYEFDQRAPFWALGDAHRVATVDVPQARVVDGVNGVQFTAWGAHSPQAPTETSPPELKDELIRKHGASKLLHDDYGQSLRLEDLERIRSLVPGSVRQRTAICRDLLGREDWDLFLTVFSEPHVAGHNFLQASWPEHPLYDVLKPRVVGDPMREAYELCDEAVGKLLAEVGPDTAVVVFSVHGVGPNTKDLPIGVFLPELLFRWNFPGRQALTGKRGQPLPAPYTECGSFSHEVWQNKWDESPLRRRLLSRLPYGAFTRLEPYLGSGRVCEKGDLISPFALGRQTSVVPWMGCHWYKPLWPHMKAFSIPSFSEACIRINVRGREGRGIVDPADFGRVCDEVMEVVQTMRDARRGIPMITNVEKTRSDPFDTKGGPAADILVTFQDEYAADCVEAPGYGRIGPVPHYRAGSHLSEGFAAIRHPAVAPGTQLPQADVLDLAPTILELMGAPRAPHLQGRPMVTPGVGVRT